MKIIKYLIFTAIGTTLSLVLQHESKEKVMGSRERELILNDLSRLDK